MDVIDDELKEKFKEGRQDIFSVIVVAVEPEKLRGYGLKTIGNFEGLLYGKLTVGDIKEIEIYGLATRIELNTEAEFFNNDNQYLGGIS